MWRRVPGDVREYRDSRHRRAFGGVAGLGIPRPSAASLRPQGVIYIKVWHLFNPINFWRYEEIIDFELRSSLLALGKPKASFGLLSLIRSLGVRGAAHGSGGRGAEGVRRQARVDGLHD